MLDKEFATLSLKLAFLVYRAKPIFDLVYQVQVVVTPTWQNSDSQPRPQMHWVWNQLTKLHAQLEDR